jgi:hypothetical protein
MGSRTITYCDRCGRECNAIVPIVVVEITVVSSREEESPSTAFNNFYDLCPACKDLVIDKIKEALR